MFRKWKNEWLSHEQDKLRLEFESRLSSLKEQYELQLRRMESIYKQKQDDLAYESKRVEDSKIALAKCNEDLRQQIKLIEAKASPDQVWVSAFSSGFNTAYSSMAQFLQQDVEVKRSLIHDTAYNEAIGHLEPAIQKRLDEVGNSNLKSTSDILAKKEDFEARLSTAQTESEKLKFKSYISTLEWVLSLNGNQLHKD